MTISPPAYARRSVGGVQRGVSARAVIAACVAVDAGAWDEAVVELDTCLALVQASDHAWISIAVGQRAYVDAHRGQVDAARNRLAAFGRSDAPRQSELDFPGLAGLAALEAEGAVGAAVARARALWAAAPARGESWVLILAPDVARVALVGRERALLERVAEQVAAVNGTPDSFTSPTAALTGGMAVGDRAAVARADERFTASGLLMAAAHAREEYACLAAAAGDRGAAVTAMEGACAIYDRAGAAVHRARLLSRLRARGIRRGPRSRHRTAVTGWAALTPTERRVAELVRTGRTNPEIAARLYVSPRTVQTHVSHILAKLGVRSRGEVARVTPEPQPARDARDRDGAVAGPADVSTGFDP